MKKELDPVAQRVQVLLVDDLSGEEAQETVRFALDGADYEIDLTDEHAAKLRSELEPYLSKGRRVRPGATARPAKPASGTSAASRDETRQIREWAQQNGFAPSDRGRISKEIREAYAAAHK